MKNSSFLRLFLILLVACFSTNAGLLKENYQHHSLYVYNFVKYIQWPNVSNELIIGVSGGNPAIMEAFEKMAISKTSPELKLTVRKVQSPGDASACHILYIPEAESSKVPVFASRTEGSRLILTEGSGMLQKGGMINFVMVDRKLRFEIDQVALENAGLKVSSQLVMMAVQM